MKPMMKRRRERHYSSIWEAIKQQFIAKSPDLVRVEVHSSKVRNLIRMVQKEKWLDDHWGLSGYTKLETESIEPSDSGYEVVTFKLVPHNKGAIYSEILAQVNPRLKPTAGKLGTEFKLR